MLSHHFTHRETASSLAMFRNLSYLLFTNTLTTALLCLLMTPLHDGQPRPLWLITTQLLEEISLETSLSTDYQPMSVKSQTTTLQAVDYCTKRATLVVPHIEYVSHVHLEIQWETNSLPYSQITLPIILSVIS
jgi:hypothetical protein